MVVIPRLIGGTGNCIFVISTALAYILKHGCDCCIPTVIYSPHSKGQKVFYSPYLRYCDKEPEGIKITYNEPRFEYDEIPKFKCDVLVLNGYFQSYKYFIDYMPQIRKIILFNNLQTKHNRCSIHVRRSDYLLYPDKHPVVSNKYLILAIQEIYNRTDCDTFIVFGDDMEWNKLFFKNIKVYDGDKEIDSVKFIFSDSKSEVEDFNLMASCEHNVISNSTFSLMASILNPNENKVCIAPAAWFGENLNHNTMDLLPPNYLVI